MKKKRSAPRPAKPGIKCQLLMDSYGSIPEDQNLKIGHVLHLHMDNCRSVAATIRSLREILPATAVITTSMLNHIINKSDRFKNLTRENDRKNFLDMCAEPFSFKFIHEEIAVLRSSNMEVDPAQDVVGTKRDFGSFHSSNVQELVEAPEESYVPPDFPFGVPDFANCRGLKFGEETRRKHFLLEDCTFLNHGAFGAVLKDALKVAQQWQRYIEKQPLRFFDREVLPHMAYVTRRLAEFVGCEAIGIVLVPNVTTAINAVVRSIPFKKGERIFCLNITYGAVKKLLKHTAESLDLEYQEENLNLPLTSNQEILDLVSSKLSSNTRLAVFDHIPSNAAFIMPVKELISICRERGVPVLIDGAHALGALPLDMKDLSPDYYTANAHKWLCNPKGCAFLYVREELRSQTRPLVVSHGFGSGFNSEFIWSGLRDYSPFLALHTVLDFWNAVGVKTIRQGMHGLLSQAVDLLTKSWNTGLLAPIEMCGSMALVELPHEISDNQTVEYSLAEGIQNELYHQFNIEVPIKALQGRLYVRISAHIYNKLSEYQRLASAVLYIAKSSRGGDQARDAKVRKLNDPR
ncbi:L-cysteine desulfhydrase-like [Lytechinus variegatus]|uniref:L-cysteine desulfhydrase-like n=1 Tax=Lytechinus variegatus TaxID=7654 RepID=UPI001BB25F18|nr:L-cysteine desulfhydrase-like [Lytechinus variegatus]XP_041463184.1 L-cysteine desulfhydrase-like [Lytechinus variegatus]